MDKPTEKPSISRPRESSHTTAKTSSEECSQEPKALRDMNAQAPDRCKRAKHIRRTTSIEDLPGPVVLKNLACGLNPQPCLHYNSIINHNPGTEYRDGECPYKKKGFRAAADLRAVPDWNLEHPRTLNWWNHIPANPQPRTGCEADEWPPAALYFLADGYAQLEGRTVRNINKPQFIRLMDGNQNNAAGKVAVGCPAIASREDVGSTVTVEVNAGTTTSITKVKCVYTRTTLRLNMVGLDAVLLDPLYADDGLIQNSCYPRGNPGQDYRGFALLSRDGWYDRNPAARVLRDGYKGAAPFALDNWADPDQLVVSDGNSSRKLTDKELKDKFGLVRCQSGDEACREELQEFAEQGAVVHGQEIDEVSGSVSTTLVAATQTNAPSPGSGVSLAGLPQQTQGL
jgi:chitinase